MCFVLSHLLFNFQGPLPQTRLVPSRGGFSFYHTSRYLSRGFSNFFQKLFSKSLLALPFGIAVVWALDYYIITSCVCQVLFSSFFQNFSRLASGRSPALQRSDIIALSLHIVKGFSSFFSLYPLLSLLYNSRFLVLCIFSCFCVIPVKFDSALDFIRHS